jgi:hypothetical protein
MTSDAERVVSIIFNGVDNVSSVSGKIGSQLSAIGNVVEGVARPFAVLGENVLKNRSSPLPPLRLGDWFTQSANPLTLNPRRSNS